MSKLYLITRRDLRHGSQAAQLVHGMSQFALDYPETFESWQRSSNTVVCLAVEDENELTSLYQRAERISEDTECGLPISTFREPDFNEQLTCVVLAPDPYFSKLCEGIRLACC
jgi:peptidyl-tRNA hydrolase